MNLPDSNPKTRFGVAKPGIADVPMAALLHLGLAMRDGKQKYGRTNWREHEVTAFVYFDAAFRHLAAWWDGEEVAPDSGVHHLGHVMACCSILLDAQAQGKLQDDRPSVPGQFSRLVAQLTRPMDEKPSVEPPVSQDTAQLSKFARALGLPARQHEALLMVAAGEMSVEDALTALDAAALEDDGFPDSDFDPFAGEPEEAEETEAGPDLQKQARDVANLYLDWPRNSVQFLHRSSQLRRWLNSRGVKTVGRLCPDQARQFIKEFGSAPMVEAPAYEEGVTYEALVAARDAASARARAAGKWDVFVAEFAKVREQFEVHNVVLKGANDYTRNMLAWFCRCWSAGLFYSCEDFFKIAEE